MDSSTDDVANCEPVYVLVPSAPLPVVDLSKTLRGQFMPEHAVGSMHNFLKRFNRPLFLSYATALTLATFIPMLDAITGRCIAVVCCVLALPLGLGSLGALRYDVVLLIVRTFDFWFFFSVTTSTTILLSRFSNNDLRISGWLLQWVGFQNAILIDAQVRGIRQLAKLTLLAIIPITIILVWVALDHVDETINFSILSYESEHYRNDLVSVDVIVNGLVTLILLLAKIGHRKRKILKSRAGSTVLECTIYRCSLELKLVGSDSALPTGSQNLADTPKTEGSTRSTTGLNQPDLLQQMRFVKTERAFDSRRVIFPIGSTENVRFQTWARIPFYAVGGLGLILSFPAAVLYESRHLIEILNEWQLLLSWIALLSTVVFVAPFVALYQKDLLKSLCFSFDFAFYSFQTMSASICLCAMSQWRPSRGIALLSQTIWIHWVFTLDALTPVMRDKLFFHPRYAAPIIILFLLGQIAVIAIMFYVGTMTIRDVSVWKGIIWDRHITVSVMPFYFSRVVTLLPWCSRLAWRVWRTSRAGMTVVRGTVAYHNCFAAKAQKRSRRLSTMAQAIRKSAKALRHARVHVLSQVSTKQVGPTLPAGVQWSGNANNPTVINLRKLAPRPASSVLPHA